MPEKTCIRCHKPMDDTPFCPFCGAKQDKKRNTRKRPNGLGTAEKHGPTWRARVVVGWKWSDEKQRDMPVFKTKGGFKTKSEALAACPGLLDAGYTKKAPPLLHYWEEFSGGEMEKLSESKRTAYKIAWERMKELHFSPVDKITASDLRRVTNANAKTYYPARDMKNLFSHLFKLAGADSFASRDLPSYIDLPKLEEKSREAFTDLEQAALWKSYEAGNKDARYPLIMIYTGMMTGELLKLTVDMIDLDAAQIVGVGMKTEVRKAAPVYIPEAIAPILAEMCQEVKSGKLIRVNKDNFYARYYDALEAAGVRKLSPYSCRHTTATALAITEGIAPQTIRKVMRWSTTRMLDRYAHPSDDDAKAAINTMKRQDVITT